MVLVGGSRVGENTYNSRLAQVLKERGFDTADFELIFPTFKGLRKPDVAFATKRGLGIVSAKLGSTKEVDALSSAQEYQQTIGSSEKMAETFAVTYPAEHEKAYHLRVLANNIHGPLSWTFNSLELIADKIIEIINLDLDKAKTDLENPIEAAIRVLGSGVRELSSSMKSVSTTKFKMLFGEGHLFESILGYNETYEEKESAILHSAASYLLVNQILFYEILSRELPNEYTIIEKEDYERPDKLQPKYFDKVLLKDYTPIFGFDIASHLSPIDAGGACKKIILSIKALFPHEIEHDLIGKVFHNLIPLDIRKTVGAYFTNSQAADLLARLSIESDSDKVIDPACGSGTLLVSSYKQKLALSGKKLNRTVHKQYLEQDITGIDIMPFSAHLAAVHLTLRGLPYETDNVRIAIEDSTEHHPGDIVQPVREQLKSAFQTRRVTDFLPGMKHHSQKAKRGAVVLRDKRSRAFTLDSADVVIMNPPFTSCDNLPSEYKNNLKNIFHNPTSYAECITGKLSFQAYFMLLADRFLKQGGRLASVLPLTTFTGKAFRKINEFILSNYTVKYVIVSLGRSAFSDNTALAEILFVAKKEKPTKNHHFVLVGTKTSPNEWTPHDIETIENQIRKCATTGKTLDSKLCVASIFTQDTLLPSGQGLASIVSRLDSSFADAYQNTEKSIGNSLITFAELEKKIGCKLFAYELRIKGGAHYGFSALSVVGNEDRAMKKTDVLIFHGRENNSLLVRDRRTEEIRKIPLHVIYPQIRRFSGLHCIDASKLNDYVIRNSFSGLRELFDLVYTKPKTQIFLTRSNEWTKKVDKGSANIVFARKIDLSASGTTLLAVYNENPMFMAADAWGIKSISSDDAKILALWMNSSFFLLDILLKRATTRGTWGRFDEHLLFRVWAPDLTKLSNYSKKELLKIYDNVCQTQFPSLMEQLKIGFNGRRAIDMAFLKSFSVGIDKYHLDELYKILYSKMQKLKETMRFN